MTETLRTIVGCVFLFLGAFIGQMTVLEFVRRKKVVINKRHKTRKINWTIGSVMHNMQILFGWDDEEES